RRYMVFAGSRRGEPGGGRRLSEPLPGMIIVEVSQVNGEMLAGEGGQYQTEGATGPLRIVDADGSKIYLLSDTGKTFAFDLVERRFLPVEENLVLSRPSGGGEIIERRDAPFSVQGFQVENYWIKNGEQTVIVLAGQLADGPKQAKLIVLVSAPDDPKTIIEKAAYSPQPVASTLRVVQVEGDQFTLLTNEGLIYMFDISTRMFVFAPHGEHPITKIFSDIQINLSK
ncbi:MAG: hypothetical protein M1511_13045, partial [Deltaproteobacteria bacterium]|nr:hypothetical protein [Deltaproteobacteria bacterium]